MLRSSQVGTSALARETRASLLRTRWVECLAGALAVSSFLLASGAALARAPIAAPEPPRKVQKDSGATSTTSDSANGESASAGDDRTLDADQARQKIMQQLIRAAEAGLVDLQPLPGDEAAQATALLEQDEVLDDRPADIDDMPEAATAEAAKPRPAIEPSEVATRTEAEIEPSSSTVSEDDGLGSAGTVVNPVPAESENPERTPPVELVDAEPSLPPRAVEQCFARERLLLPDYPSSTEFINAVAEKRRSLVGEFDTGDPETAIDLAKSYISVGFTLEAKTVIAEYASEHPLGQFLTDASGLLDGQPAPAGSAVLTPDCLGSQALWRALSQALADESASAIRSELSGGNSLEEFPSFPRQMISARLGLAAADVGQWDTARRMEAMALRSAKGLSFGTLGQTHLLSHALSAWREDPERARMHLELATNGDAESALTALMMRAEGALNNPDGESDLDRLIADLGELARKEIGTPLGAKAFGLEARLFSRNASLSKTISFLSDATEIGLLDPAKHTELLSELVSSGDEKDETTPLAIAYLEDPATLNGHLDQAPLRRALVTSLAEVGLPAMAQTLLRDGDLTEEQVALALADAFLEADDPREAVVVLSEAPISSLQRGLLGRAFLDLGDAERAASMLSAALEGDIRDPDVRSDIVNAKLAAERQTERTQDALDTALQLLGDEAEQQVAVQTAFMALDAEEGNVPDAVRGILEQGDASELDTLDDLFRLNGSSAGSDMLSDGGVEQYLQDLEAGERAIREVLNDG